MTALTQLNNSPFNMETYRFRDKYYRHTHLGHLWYTDGRRFKSKARAVDLAIRAASLYQAEVRLTTEQTSFGIQRQLFPLPY